MLRPTVTLKLATSLDGRIATVLGHSKWITGSGARARVHGMRAEHDCVLTGIGTILADDPELTARTDPRPQKQPLRVVLDTNTKIPPDCSFLATAHIGKICLIHGVGWSKNEPVEHPNIQRCYVDRAKGPNSGVKSIMVEAGARLAGSFLRAGLVDKIVWFRAPIIIGGDGLSVFSALDVEDLSQALVFDCLDVSKCGDDLVETYALKKPH
jgi:diaminohydroxyphosphoribosylaminopyrimidine deaminase / 5-amino-6-(5-phosphoribosylamino)uracil reductase